MIDENIKEYNTSTGTSITSHDIIPLKDSKIEVNNMSFVGFIRSNDGILAFGDTKGTRGKFQPEYEERGKIRKVFQNEHLILITFGNNEIGGWKIKIEKEIENLIIKQNMDAFSFIEAFKKITKENYDEREFNFVIYNKKTDTFYSIICKGKSNNSFGIIENIISKGVSIYQDALEELSIKHDFLNYSVDENETFFNDVFNKLVQKIDETGFYNAVGLPFIYEKYKFLEE